MRASAWEDVVDLSASLGIVLDPWQENVLQAAMGERSDGTWAARQVALSAPRQQGKSQLIVVRALAGILLFGEETIIVSAHQQDTAREVFGRIVDLIDANQFLADRVNHVYRAINREQIDFVSGQSIRFKARSVGSGRGFSCDCLLLDEAQILSSAAWSAILPTMSARPNPQAWLLGTPPTVNDDGEVFGRLRDIGLSRKESRVAYLEWAAERDDPIDDPATWAKANPAYGSRIDYDAVAAELASMSEDQFRLERLGVWSECSSVNPVIGVARWAGMAGVGPEPGARPNAFGVDMSHGREISVGACWVLGDSAHVEEVWADGDGAACIEWLVNAAGRRIEVVVDSFSPAAALVPELQSAGVNVRLLPGTGTAMAQACGMFEERSKSGSLTHASQERLSAAVAGATRRPIRDVGGWGWDRRSATAKIHPLVAVTLALFGAANLRRKPLEPRKVVVLS